MPTLRVPVNENDHQKGNRSAPVTLVEYGDYECPYCGKAYPVVKQRQEEFGENLNFVFRNFPLRKVHPNAFLAAVSTEAAGKQKAFWEMHDLLFENQPMLSSNPFLLFAQQLKLNADQFAIDLEDELLKNKVEKDFENGLRSGVNQTPSFFINGERVEGPTVYLTLKNAINQALMKQTAAGSDNR